MTAGDKAKKMLLVDEGLRLKPYRCTAGKTSIGYGRNLDDVGISQRVADIMLEEDLQVAEKACRRIFPGLFDQWGENRRLGWVNLAFNLGYNRLMQFRNTLRAARIEDWAEVEKGLRASLWFQQVGKRAERVIGMVCHETFPYD
jgi:lysozyme